MIADITFVRACIDISNLTAGLTSDRDTKEITDVTEIEEALSGSFPERRVMVVPQSLSIYGPPAVTVAPLPAPAVATPHLFRPSDGEYET